MKLKKLTAVVVVVIAIGLSVFGCNPLPDSSSLNSSSNSSSEKVDLPLADKELWQLIEYSALHNVFHLRRDTDEIATQVFQSYFTNEFKDNKPYFLFLDIASIKNNCTDPFLANYYEFYHAVDSENQKEVLYLCGYVAGDFDRPPEGLPKDYKKRTDYHFRFFSFGQKTLNNEYTYVLKEIEGYKYNKLITVFVGEEEVARFYYCAVYNHIADEYFLNLLKTSFYHTQVDKNGELEWN